MSDLSRSLKGTPVLMINADLCQISHYALIAFEHQGAYLIVIAVVRVGVGDDLPVHPWNSCQADFVRIVLDVIVSGQDRQRVPGGAVVVRSVEVAHPPLLHDQLLARLLSLLYVGSQSIFSKVCKTICMDRNDVQCVAREVRVLGRCGKIRSPASRDKNVRSALKISLDCACDGALPVSKCGRIFLRCVTTIQVDGHFDLQALHYHA